MRIQSRTRGFTLIELVVVVGILVVLAGLVLPNLDVLNLRANKGVASTTMADLSRSVQQYYTQRASYPDRWDSLLTDTGELWVPGEPGGDPGLDPGLVGGPPVGSPTKLTTLTLTEPQVRSLTRMGIATLLDLEDSTEPPGSRFLVARPIDTGEVVATLNPTDGKAQGIIRSLYPRQADPDNPVIPTGKNVVVFGFGPTNNMVGEDLQVAPFYPGVNATQYYNRYLAIFEIDDGGGRARMMAIMGGDGDPLEEEIYDFFKG